MIATNIFSQYWHLFRWLMIPARYHYWLFMLSLVVTVIAVFSVVVGSLFNVGDWRLVFVGIWAIVFSIWSFSAVLVLHGQLMSLPSNRQLRLISGVRQRALVIHWVVLTIMAILLTACQYFLKEMKFTLDSVILNWSLFSLASVTFLLCLKWFGSFSLLCFGLFWMALSIFAVPFYISPWLLFALALVIWLGFSYWWLRWFPAKKIENIFLLRNWRSTQLAASNNWTKIPINMLAPRIKNMYTPVSLYLHLLNGVTGNALSRVIIWLVIGSFCVLGIGLLIVLFDYGGIMRDMAHVAIPITLWTFLSSAGMGYFTGLFASIGRVWFYFPGARVELLGAVERNFILSLVIDLIFVCILTGLACYWVFPEYLLIKWIVLYCLLVLVVNWLLFHFVWYLYCRTQGNSNLLGVAIFLIIIMQLFLAGVGWSLVSGGKISADLIMLGAIGCCFPAALLLRSYAKKATPNMSFARGKV
jgi:hypothetical protein